MLSRRLKNRISPAAFFGLKPKRKSRAKEATLVIIATFFLAPEAFAQISSKKAEAVFTRTYTKEDLKHAEPANPSKGLGDILKDHATALFSRMTAQQSGNNTKLLEFQGQVRELSDEERAMRLDGFQQDTERKLDSNGLVTFLRSQSQKAAGEHVKDSNETLRKIKNGMAVKLNLGSLFTGKKKSEQLAEGTVRYGLLIKDIVPDNQGMSRAAVSGSAPSDLKYAGHAEVKWTIGPVYEDGNRKIFNIIEPSKSESDESGLWAMIKKIRTPSPNFTARIEPGTADEASAASASSGGKARLPVKGVIAQEEGYYTLTYTTAGSKGVAQHEVKIPVAGELAVGRRFDDKFEVVQSSVFNVLVDKRAPILSVHYLHLEDRIKSEMVAEAPGRKISVETSRKVKKDPAADPASQRDTYTVNYTKDF